MALLLGNVLCSFLVLVLISMVRAVRSIDESVIAWREIVALANTVVVWGLLDGHVRVFELLSDLRRPLLRVSVWRIAQFTVGETNQGQDISAAHD